MAAGDVNTLGPYDVFDKSAIDTGLTGAAVVADTVIPIISGSKVLFVVIKAA